MSQTTTEFTIEDSIIANLSETDRHKLLMNERRRLTLDILSEQNTPVELSDLAAKVARREEGPESTEETVKSISISLHHIHLPQMDELDVIDYDGKSNTITK